MPNKPILNTASLKSGGIFDGYRFNQDSISNQLAYAFGGEDGEKAAKEILKAANDKFGDDQLQLPDKNLFIENAIKKRSTELDEKLQTGLSNIFARLQDKKVACQGGEAEKDAVVALMHDLGINVDPDNVQTHYEPGPPQVFQITFVLKPTDNLKNKDSFINKLAESYTNSCSAKPEAKEEFKNSWNQHVQNANLGGPKVPKDEFLKMADESFKNTLTQLKTPKKEQTDNAIQIEEDSAFKLKNG